MSGFTFPERYLIVRYMSGDIARGCYVSASELERLEHEWEQSIGGGRDRLLTITRLSGESLHVRTSDLLLIAEQSLDSLANDFAIEAMVAQLEQETKRSILGPDYDPDRD